MSGLSLAEKMHLAYVRRSFGETGSISELVASVEVDAAALVPDDETSPEDVIGSRSEWVDGVLIETHILRNGTEVQA